MLLLFAIFNLFYISCTIAMDLNDPKLLDDLRSGFGELYKKENNPCLICREELPDAWPAKIDLCKSGNVKHSFCTKCLKSLMDQTPPPHQLTCPSCRESISLGKRNFIVGSWALHDGGIHKDNVHNMLTFLESGFDNVEQEFLQFMYKFKECAAKNNELVEEKKKIEYLISELKKDYEKSIGPKILAEMLASQNTELIKKYSKLKEKTERLKCKLAKNKSKLGNYKAATKILGTALVRTCAYIAYKQFKS